MADGSKDDGDKDSIAQSRKAREEDRGRGKLREDIGVPKSFTITWMNFRTDPSSATMPKRIAGS